MKIGVRHLVPGQFDCSTRTLRFPPFLYRILLFRTNYRIACRVPDEIVRNP
jgi:hypothetical protein